ncbi:MAG: hypothetical protein ACI93R_002203 [Flavobacteriales bacterium]
MNIGSHSSSYVSPVAADLAVRVPQALARVGSSQSALSTRPVDTLDANDASRPLTGEDNKSSRATNTAQEEGKEGQAKVKQEKAEQAQEAKVVTELSSRDREVRAHEAAHAAVGGQYAGAPSYEFQRGPDGVNYAVGGEVSIDVGREASAAETIQKMLIVKAAALAPAEPSGQDMKVAAQATQQMVQAQQELASERREKAEESSETTESTSETAASKEGQNSGDQQAGSDNGRDNGVDSRASNDSIQRESRRISNIFSQIASPSTPGSLLSLSA